MQTGFLLALFTATSSAQQNSVTICLMNGIWIIFFKIYFLFLGTHGDRPNIWVLATMGFFCTLVVTFILFVLRQGFTVYPSLGHELIT